MRRKKCDEGRPSCAACSKLCLKCDYVKPSWWMSMEQRRLQKERIKDRIRQTKVIEREGSMRGVYHATVPFLTYLTIAEYMHHMRETFAQRTPATVQYGGLTTPVSASDVSPTYDGIGLPPFQGFFPGPGAVQCGIDQAQAQRNAQIMDELNRPLLSFQSTIPVEDRDRPLLAHFLDHVLQLIFPILELHQRRPARASEILRSLQTNRSYLHCCLSVSAIHIKTTMNLSAEQIDSDIMRHRYEAVSQLSQALRNCSDQHEQILDATLAMIFFHCSVGAPDDYLPDIPWNAHFQAVSNLINKLNFVPQPFSMSLISWIDIFGATMLGKSPQFAHTYRNRHINGTSSGLQELMGCDDHVMYLISEIACLESLKTSGRIHEAKLRHHISALSMQLEHTASADATLEWPCTSPGGTVEPQKLTASMSALFCIAARIYLRSLAPNFSCNQPSIISLVGAAAEILRYIPAGVRGFDRAIVWPLLITGAHSIPSSPFRSILAERASALSDLGDFGSFGRMYRLLQELWRLNDDLISPPLPSSATSLTFPERLPEPSQGTPGRSLRKQQVHWRDVMQRRGWGYLLM